MVQATAAPEELPGPDRIASPWSAQAAEATRGHQHNATQSPAVPYQPHMLLPGPSRIPTTPPELATFEDGPLPRADPDPWAWAAELDTCDTNTTWSPRSKFSKQGVMAPRHVTPNAAPISNHGGRRPVLASPMAGPSSSSNVNNQGMMTAAAAPKRTRLAPPIPPPPPSKKVCTENKKIDVSFVRCKTKVGGSDI